MKTKFVKLILLIMIIIITLVGCGSRDIPVTTNEQHLSGITVENAAVITEAVVDVFDQPDIYSTRKTQVFFNQVVKIVEEQNTWVEIKLLDGSSGWVRSKYVSRDTDCVTNGSIDNKIIVTAKSVEIFTGTTNQIKYKQIVLGTELYSYDKTKTGYKVLLPDNKRGWVEEGGVIAIPISDSIIPKTTAKNFIETINKFKGTIFILGGVSKWGIDSTGLVYISSRINGADLPRQIENMIKAGSPVLEEDMQEGDLIFFSTDSTKKDVFDVGVYLGDDIFIHSHTTRGVITDSLKESYYKDRVCGIRRIF